MKKLLFSLVTIGMLTIGCGENDDVISPENGSLEDSEIPTPPNPQPNPQDPADEIIIFEDPIVKQICVSLWDTNGDNQLSKAEAAAVKSIGLSFSNQPSMRAFTELKYFTGLTHIEDGAFACMIYDHTSHSDMWGSYDYYNYGSLAKITIPKNIGNIGYIFSDYFEGSITPCNISIYFTRITPPYISSPAFGIKTGKGIVTLNIYVPNGTLDSYKSAMSDKVISSWKVYYHTYTPQDED